MTLEQKAKAYDEAIERAKEELGSGCFNKGSIEYIFPELKESEDEKVRNWLIDYFEGWQTRAIDENAAYYKDIAIKDILAWLEKLKDFDKQLDEAYQTANAVVYKKGYDDGYLEGVVNAKKELEKSKPTVIDIDKMVSKYANTKESCTGNLPLNCQIRAYRQGINNALNLLLDIEKPITIGKRQLTGKAKELYENLDEKSLEETKEKMLAETSKWTDEDERIRKWLLNFVQGIPDQGLDFSYYNIGKTDVLAWLEKQGEQKPFDYENANIQQKDFAPKVEPKFKVGDWIVHNKKDSAFLVAYIDEENQRYVFEIGGYSKEQMNYEDIEFADTHYHLWSITDAKDGDVLVEDSCIFIIQKLGNKSTFAKTYCSLYSDGDFYEGTMLYFDVDSTKPATKEQCELLFREIEEKGFEWNATTKELSHKEMTKKSEHDGKKWIDEKVYWKEREELFEDGKQEVINNPMKYGLIKDENHIANDSKKVEPKVWSEEDGK